jgi:hypothetical protein
MGRVMRRIALSPNACRSLSGKPVMRDVRVQFGDLVDFFGMPGRAENFTFVPASVTLHGETFSHSHPLHGAVGDYPPAILSEPLREGFESVWVRARLPQVFSYEPETPSDGTHLLQATFLAIETDSPHAYPFHCTDSGGRAALIFSPSGPDAATQAKIAHAFWSVLLHKPEDLAEFESRVLERETAKWSRVGYRAGQLRRERTEQ